MQPKHIFLRRSRNHAHLVVNNTKKSRLTKVAGRSLFAVALGMSGCQTLQPDLSGNTQTSEQAEAIDFRIMGKIGVNTLLDGKRQTGSAFYAWGQTGERFAIDITGALGIGKTYIEGVPGSAKMISEKTGEIEAATPEELLYIAAKWRAPISQLPYWIMGRPTVAGNNHKFDETGRLTASQHDNWQVVLTYPSETAKLPNKLKMTQLADDDSMLNKVILTITERRE